MVDVEAKEPSLFETITSKDLIKLLWKEKILLVVTTTSFCILSVWLSFLFPNVYKSEALLAPIAADKGMNLSGQLGGIAALAGISLDGDSGNTGLAIEVMKSREFLSKFFVKYDLLKTIMAVNGWDRASGDLLIDPDIFDENTNTWVREVSLPYESQPSLNETFIEFSKQFSISQNSETGYVTVWVEHYSPIVAQKLVNSLVYEINLDIKTREVIDARNAIEFLKNEVEKY